MKNDGPDMDYTLRRILATLERIEKRLDEPVKTDQVRVAGLDIRDRTEGPMIGLAMETRDGR